MDKNIRRKVNEEWRNALPQLSLCAQNRFFKVVGCVIIGLELIKLPRTDEYRPHFVIYPLWKKDVKASLDFLIILKEYYNNKGFQYSIPYVQHSAFFSAILESIIKQTPLLFDIEISFKKIISVIDEYSKTAPLVAAPNSYLQASLHESKLLIGLFIDGANAQNIFEQIKERNWDQKHFRACGMDVENWLRSLQKKILNRSEFLEQIDINKQEKKIMQLQNIVLAS